MAFSFIAFLMYVVCMGFFFPFRVGLLISWRGFIFELMLVFSSQYLSFVLLSLLSI